MKIPNKIIVEGFWSTGKTALINSLAKKSDFRILPEPNHLALKTPPKNVGQWYIKKHLNRQKKFFASKKSVIMERSILSSAAFKYALGENKKQISKLLIDFYKQYEKNKPLLIFLSSEKNFIKKAATRIKDNNVSRLLQKDKFIEYYENFYRRFLPFNFGITLLFCNIRRGQKRKTTLEIKKNIILAIRHNRLAQVQIVCFCQKKDVAFLLLKRNLKKGGFWQAITGGVKLKETIFNTLKRELNEEIGIKAKIERFKNSNFSFHYIGAERYELNEYVFAYELKKSDIIHLSKEHTSFIFCPLKKAMPLLKYPSSRRALISIYKKIKRGS